MPAVVSNPFIGLAKGIGPNESIAFVVVYGLYTIALVVRMWGTRWAARPNHMSVYRFQVIFGVARMATFIFRYLVATAAPNDHLFKALLIAMGVLTVAGFLFIAEAALALLFQWFCVVRGISGEGHRIQALARHVVLMVFSIIGIIGAVLQITSVSKLDIKTFYRAQKLRQASGALFCALALYVMIATLVVLYLHHKHERRMRRGRATVFFFVCAVGLLMESIWRVWIASVLSGWATKEVAVDVLLVLPELVILTLFVVCDFDDIGDIIFFWQTHDGTVPQEGTEDDEDVEAEATTVGVLSHDEVSDAEKGRTQPKWSTESVAKV